MPDPEQRGQLGNAADIHGATFDYRVHDADGRQCLPTSSSHHVGARLAAFAYLPDMQNLGARIKAARLASGRTQQDLADVFGIKRVNVTQWEGDTTRPDPAKLPLLAETLNVSAEWLLTGKGNGPTPKSGITPRRQPSEATIPSAADVLVLGEKNVPIMGISVGGTEGEFYMNGDVVDYARRLPGIARNKNVFGVHVEGTSMEPKFEPGELVYASPSRPPVSGDYIIVELAPTEGERAGPAYVKRLVRRSGTRLICQQFNPPGEIEYDQREVRAVYRILSMSELVGF